MTELVEWFYEQGFKIDATAPYAEGTYLVDCFSTAEALTDHPDYERFSSEDVEDAIYEIDGDDRDPTGSTGWWWNPGDWYDDEEERAA